MKLGKGVKELNYFTSEIKLNSISYAMLKATAFPLVKLQQQLSFSIPYVI